MRVTNQILHILRTCQHATTESEKNLSPITEINSQSSIIRLIHQKMVQKCCLLLRMILLIKVSAHARPISLVGRIPQEHCAEKSCENNWIRPVFSRM